jgi:membrane-associated phospholipid phosphatase
LMYARLYLNAHTPMQVVCGFLLGLTTTFLPILIIYA